MSNNSAPGPSSRGASVSAQLSRRQRQAGYVAGNNTGIVSRGGFKPRGGFNPRGGLNRGGHNPRGGYVPGGGYGARGNYVGPRGGGANRGFVPRGNPAFRGAGRGRGGGIAQSHPNAASRPSGGSPPKRTVATWTVQIGEVVYSYVSRVRWRDQGRPLRGMAPESVPEAFKGRTLEARHPNEPKAVYTEEEMDQLCPSCGTLVIHWDTHVAGKLHEEKLKKPTGTPAQPSQMDVVAALRVLQATRPDIIAASLAASSSSAAAGSSRDGNGPPRDDYMGGGDYGRPRDGYDSPRDDYDRSQDDFERSRDDFERSRDDFERSRYDYGASLDDYGPSDDDFGRSRDGFRPLDAMADEDLDGVPADHLDDLFPLPMRGRSPDDDRFMPPAKFPRG
ncbi:unnamed protein product, partial [Ixodes hexagonus]